MRIINGNVNRQRNKTLKQYEHSMWEKHAFSYVGIVEKLNEVWDGDELISSNPTVKLIPSISYQDYDMQKGFKTINTNNKTVTCLRAENLSLVEGDVVVVIFTDLDSRKAIDEIRKGRNKKDNFNVEANLFHDYNFGIIISKLII